jgi:glycosyltransferase involved in cell wall biosynthesis
MQARFTVAQIYKGFPPVRGGIEGHVALLARLLADRGIASEVLCASAPGAPRDSATGLVRVHRSLTPLTVASTPLPPLLPLTLWRSRAEIVHLHYPWPPGEVAWMLGNRGRPLVVTVHCEVVRQRRLARFFAPLTQRLLAHAARIVVSGPFMCTHPLLAPHAARICVIPHGVDLDCFRPNPLVQDPAPHIPHPRVLFVGRLRHYKGLPVLAAALARLPGAHLIVLGDGPERGALTAALTTQGCRDRAHLMGDVDDDTLLRHLQTADVFASSSTSPAEAFGLAVAEAQASGLPAVTTEVGTATSYTVADGVSGRVIPPSDVSALADALAWCLERGRNAHLRAAARAHAEAALCARRMATATERVYLDALDDR